MRSRRSCSVSKLSSSGVWPCSIEVCDASRAGTGAEAVGTACAPALPVSSSEAPAHAAAASRARRRPACRPAGFDQATCSRVAPHSMHPFTIAKAPSRSSRRPYRARRTPHSRPGSRPTALSAEPRGHEWVREPATSSTVVRLLVGPVSVAVVNRVRSSISQMPIGYRRSEHCAGNCLRRQWAFRPIRPVRRIRGTDRQRRSAAQPVSVRRVGKVEVHYAWAPQIRGLSSQFSGPYATP